MPLMRPALASALLVALLAVPPAAAEFGAIGPDGWPINVEGRSMNPFPGVTADELSHALTSGDPLNQVGGITVYPYYPLMLAEAQRLAADHPDRVRLHSAGKSTLGLDLFMLEICDFSTLILPPEASDCLAPDGDKREVVWVDGGHHSNEYSGVYFTLAWAQYLVEQYGIDETATWIVENRHTWIMPMVNPDGSHAMGRLNANGVNINRNYPVIWGALAEDPVMNNPGPSPGSEVETQANIAWFNLTRPDYSASIHCCGNLWLYPYGMEGLDPIDNPMLQRVCDEAFADVRDACGPIWSTIYPAAGSSVDTAYEYAGMVAFGFEMSGRGRIAPWGQPLTQEEVRTQETESWQGLLHAFLNVHLYGAHLVIDAVEPVAGGVQVKLRNDGYGNLSQGAIQYGAVGDPRLGLDSEAAIAVPFLEANATATVFVPVAEKGPYHGLVLEYPKRLVATTNTGRLDLPLAFTSQGATAAPEGGFLLDDGAAADAGAVDSPGAPMAALAIGLAALAIFARRR